MGKNLNELAKHWRTTAVGMVVLGIAIYHAVALGTVDSTTLALVTAAIGLITAADGANTQPPAAAV